MSTDRQQQPDELAVSMGRSRGSGRTARIIALVFALVAAGCGSRYEHEDWPDSPFPDSKEFLALEKFAKLRFSKDQLTGIPGLQIQVEMLADGKFDFDARLMMHFPQEGKIEDKRVKAILFQARYPVSEENAAMGLQFLGVFEKNLKTDLSRVREAYIDFARNRVLNRPFTQISGQYVIEVCGIHQVTRGDFLDVGVYEKWYYDRIWRSHEPTNYRRQ
jgi:hypothetical protein